MNTQVTVAQSQGAVAEHVASDVTQAQPLNLTAHTLGSQTITLSMLGCLVDITSQRVVGLQHKRSITIHPENLDAVIKGLTAIRDAGRRGKQAATVVLRDGMVLK